MTGCMSQHVCEYVCRRRIIVFVCWHNGYLILLSLDEHRYRYHTFWTFWCKFYCENKYFHQSNMNGKQSHIVFVCFCLFQVDLPSTRWTLLLWFPYSPTHRHTHRARTSTCVCLPSVQGNACARISEMISVHCYFSEREKVGRTAALSNAHWFLL